MSAIGNLLKSRAGSATSTLLRSRKIEDPIENVKKEYGITSGSVLSQGTGISEPKLSIFKRAANVILPKSLEYKTPTVTERTVRNQQKATEKVYPETAVNPVRIPFAKEATFNISKADPLTNFVAAVGSRLPEQLVKIPVAAVNFFRKNFNAIKEGAKGRDVLITDPAYTEQFKSILGFDPRRFGIEDQQMTDSVSAMFRQVDEEESKNPGSKLNIPTAIAKTILPDVMDVLFGYDITRGLAKTGLSTVKATARQLPTKLLVKIQTSNVALDDLIGALNGTKTSDTAKNFIQSLSNEERIELFKVARQSQKAGLNAIDITTGAELTKLGKFAGAEVPTTQLPSRVAGLLKGRTINPQAGFLDIQAMGDEFVSLAKKAKDIQEFKSLLSKEQVALLTARGITAEAFFDEAKDPLLSESKKYKSADEFVKAQNRFVEERTYSVAKNKFTDYALDGQQRRGKLTVEKSPDGWRIRNIFVDDGVFGENLQRQGIATKAYESLNEQSIRETGKTLRSSDVGYAKRNSVTTLSDKGELLWKNLVKNGKAELVDNTYYRFKDSTKSQLTEIWNKANKTEVKPSEQVVATKEVDSAIPKVQELKDILSGIEDELANHPARPLLKYQKEGEFQDFKNPDRARNDFEKNKIIQKNAEIMKVSESALQGTAYSDMFDDADTIRKVIEEYKDLRTAEKEYRQEIKKLENEYITAIREQKTEEILNKLREKMDAQKDKMIAFSQKYPELARLTLKLSEQQTKGAVKGYKLGAKVVSKVIRKETMEKAKAIYDKKVANIKDDKDILANRRNFIKAVKEQFGLSDSDLKSITRRDIRLMSNFEFKEHLDRIRELSEKLAENRQARNELVAQITEKNLDIEPLRQAMQLPKIPNMTTRQLREFATLLEPYMKDDVFLSKRKLETIERTELAGIRTYREAREILAKKIGMKPEELSNIKINEWDRFKGQSALAEKDPFFRMMVEETAKLRLVREAEYLELDKTINELARKIQTTLGEKLIPQQKNIRAWFEATDKSTVQLTKAEMDIVKVMQDEWIKARDYLVKIKAMNKGIKSDNYFTHIRRGILEAAKEDGIIQAFKEVFEQYKLDEQVFNILDTQTGEVLALDKFFRFALRRTGELKPTENIVGAFLNYMKTFKKKQALDEIVPLIDIYAHALTPKGTTKTGLLLHGNIIRFTKEWLNTQKGRRITLVAKQGGKIEWALKAGRTFTTLLDLGLNVPVTIATQIGEQAIQYQLLGKGKFLLAKARALTPRGKRITAKYRNLIGKNPWTQLVEPMRNIGDRLGESIFVMFQDANYRRNRNFMLGSLTKEEWASETISPARQTQLKMAVARYGVTDGAGSIIGATPEAGLMTQYKTWALPIVGSQIRNLTYMGKYIASRGAKEGVRGKRALIETYRMVELGIFVAILGAYMVDKDDDSFLGKLKQRAYTEAMTLFGATPAIFSVPRLATYLVDLASAMSSIFKLEEYKTSKFGEYEAGDLKGTNQLQKLLTPRAIKQFDGDKTKTIDDVKKEIKKEIEDGTLSIEAAKEKFVDELKKLKTAEQTARFKLKPDEYKADIKKRIENKEITIEEAKAEYIKYAEENVDSFKSPDEGSFIDKILLYAKATGTDPVTTFIFLFQGEKIRKIENGAIIVERMPLAESQEIKKEMGATKEMVLDHTIPLQLGGGNSKGNLKLVSVDEWGRYTPVENYLGDKLRAGLIDKKEAQRLIKEFKEGKITEKDIIK